jgi:hypothetical protein
MVQASVVCPKLIASVLQSRSRMNRIRCFQRRKIRAQARSLAKSLSLDSQDVHPFELLTIFVQKGLIPLPERHYQAFHLCQI